MGISEKIKIILIKRKMTITDLSKLLETTQSNISNKLKRDNFSTKELNEIAIALNCDLDIGLILKDTKEKV